MCDSIADKGDLLKKVMTGTPERFDLIGEAMFNKRIEKF